LFSGEISSEGHIEAARGIIFDHYLPKAKIPELFLMNIEEV